MVCDMIINWNVLSMLLSTNFFAGENATITCRVESVPRSHIRWYSMEGSTEVLNNSITNRGQQRYEIIQFILMFQ